MNKSIISVGLFPIIHHILRNLRVSTVMGKEKIHINPVAFGMESVYCLHVWSSIHGWPTLHRKNTVRRLVCHKIHLLRKYTEVTLKMILPMVKCWTEDGQQVGGHSKAQPGVDNHIAEMRNRGTVETGDRE